MKKLILAVFFLFPAIAKADPTGPAGTSIRQVMDEGTGLTRREKVNFIGSAITCVDNAGNLRTDCTITAGAGASSLEVYSNVSATRSSPTAAIEIGVGLAAQVSGSTHSFRVDFSSVASRSDIISLRGYDLEPATVTPRFDRGAQFGTLAIATYTASVTNSPYLFVSSVSPPGQFALVVSSSNILTPGTTVAVYMIPGSTPTIQIRVGYGDNAVVISSTNLQLNSRRQLRLGDSDNSNYTGFVSPTVLSTNLMWRLPLSDSAGCWQSDGSGNLSIATCGSGGGTSSLVVGTGTASNFTTLVSSPTSVISFLGSQFQSTVSGTTNFISINPSILGSGGATVNVTPNSVLYSTGGTTISGDSGFQYDSSVSSVTISGALKTGEIASINTSGTQPLNLISQTVGFGSGSRIGFYTNSGTLSGTFGYDSTNNFYGWKDSSDVRMSGASRAFFPDRSTFRIYNVTAANYVSFRSSNTTTTQDLVFPASEGTAGQVLTIDNIQPAGGGNDRLTNLTWSTLSASGGGGSSTLAVGTGTASNFTNNVTSPTAAISFLGTQFQSVANGTTNFISLKIPGSSGNMLYNSGGALTAASGATYSASGSNLLVQAQNTSDVPLVVRGIASQSGNLQSWQSSGGSNYATIGATGTLNITAGINTSGYTTNSGYSGGQINFDNPYYSGFGITTSARASSPAMIFAHEATSNNGSFSWRNGTGGATTLMGLSSAGDLSVTGALSAGGLTTFSAGINVTGGPVGYGAGEIQFGSTFFPGNAIYTSYPGAAALLFDHRGTSNTGYWAWRNGTNAGTQRMALDANGNLTTSNSVTTSTVNVTARLQMNGSAGTSGQVLTSNGSGSLPTWNTISNSYIQNSNTLQSGSTFYVSSGTVSGNLTANQHISIATTTSATINQVSFYSATKKATIWTTADHGFRVGRVVRISGLTNTALNSTATITAVPTSTTFNYYVNSNVDISTTSDSGTAESYTGSIVSFQAKDSLNLYSVKISPYANGVGNYLTATTPLSGDYPIEITNSEVGSYGANYNYSINPWIAYRFNNTSTSNIARIAARASYTGSTPYDVAAIDLSNSAGGSIRFYTGGTFNGGSLTLAGTFGTDGSLSLYKPFRLTESSTQNAQFGYTNNLDSSASLFLGTNSNKGLVLQLPQYQSTNAFELQKAGGNTVDAGISYLGNWWIGGTAGNSTTRLLVTPRQTSDVVVAVQGITSQTGNLQEWQNSSSVVLSSVSASGNAFFPTVSASTVTATSVLAPPSRTLSQLNTLAPTSAGLIYYCSDCVTDGLVVSTGTAAGSFGRVSARTTAIQ